jgi:thiaminase/transcriptional activator TenA
MKMSLFALQTFTSFFVLLTLLGAPENAQASDPSLVEKERGDNVLRGALGVINDPTLQNDAPAVVGITIPQPLNPEQQEAPKLSTIAWKRSSHIYKAIIDHPFNQELMQGTLSQEVFGYYIEQDSLYLKDFGRALAMLAARSHTLPDFKAFLGFAYGALMAEEKVHQFYQETFGFRRTGKITPANIGYTSFLLQQSSLQSVEIGVAAVLPCFWIYREVGNHIARYAEANNPYERWISTYSGEEFSRAVDDAIRIFDTLAINASETTRQQMNDVFYKNCVFEWHFWNDAYKMKDFEDISLEEKGK